MGKLDSNMYVSTPDYYTDIFAGIKLYPQIGFDPYPDDLEERKKVEELYKFCIDRRIPIISHCSDGGYKVGDYDPLTSPEGKWKKVLEAFPELTLNFAHFGSQKNDKKASWRSAIIDLVEKYPNVYTDISCNDATANYYDELEKLFNGKNPALPEKLLYGSDFSINLLVVKIKSYNEYLKQFINAKLSYKNNLCEFNPKKFLFGE
jgi:predicted TIM-barrel fold metal-dependent hydrolase